MARRDASLRLTLEDSAFSAGIRRMGQAVSSAARSMGGTLKHELGEGFHAGIHGVQHLGHEIKHILGLALPIAGGLGFAEMAHHALDAQVVADRLAMKLRAVGDAHATTASVLSHAHHAAVEHKMTIEEMTTAYERLVDKTGDPVFSEEALGSMALMKNAFRSTSDEAADVVAMMSKGFGATAEQIAKEYGPALHGTLLKSGITLGQFAQHAQEYGSLAYRSGMRGVDGMKQMVGLLGLAGAKGGDAETRLNGVKLVLDKLQSKASVKMFGKELGIDTSALLKLKTPMERLRAMMGSEKGIKALEELFKRGNLRSFFEGLVAPLKEAHDAVFKQHGLTANAVANAAITKEGDAAGVKAWNEALEQAASSATTEEDMKREAEQAAQLTQRKLTLAMDRIAAAFENEKLLGAMSKLADIMPKFADVFEKAFEFVVDHPIAGGAAVVGGQFAMSATSAVAMGTATAVGKKVLAAAGIGHAAAGAAEGAAGHAAAGGGAAALAGQAPKAAPLLGAAALPLTFATIAGFVTKTAVDYWGEQSAKSTRNRQLAEGNAAAALLSKDTAKKKKALAELEAVAPATHFAAGGEVTVAAASMGDELDTLKDKLRAQIDATDEITRANQRLARSQPGSARGVNPPPPSVPGAEPRPPWLMPP